jgi:SMI1 / KNR4 family (SUKH-1)
VDALEQLGFERYRELNPDLLEGFKQESGFDLPSDYFKFLAYRPSESLLLSFRFRRFDGEEWVGQVAEFSNVLPMPDHVSVLAKTIQSYGSLSLLPISYDGAGNYLYLDLTNHGRVVDLDYGSGQLSIVAESFDGLLQMLYVE